MENGTFNYIGVALDARHNLARVRWNDPDNFYATDVEPYEDGEAIANDQGLFNPLDVTAFGCTSRGAAYRRGRYSIVTEQYEGEVVTFVTGTEAADLTPGDVIQTFNPFRSGAKSAQGRIRAVVSPTMLQLDRAPEASIMAAIQPKLCIHYVDENDRGERCTKVATIPIGKDASAGDMVALTAAPPDVPLVGQSWGILYSHLKPELWRVLGITHEGGLRHTITGHKYNASKFDAVDLGFSLVVPTTSQLPNSGVCQPPGALTVAETVTVDAASIVRALEIACAPSADPLVEDYVFSYRLNDGNWTTIEATPSTHTTLLNVGAGSYDLRACARNKLGVCSAFVTSSITITQPSPFIVTGLQLVDGKTTSIYRGRHAKFTWRIGNSPIQAVDIGDEVGGVTDGTEDPLLQGYEFGVFDFPGTGEQVYSLPRGKAHTKATFTEEENIEAFEGAYRSDYRVGVRALDASGGESAWSFLDVSNGPPGKPKALVVAHTALHTNHLLWLGATDTDIVMTHIYFTTNGDGFEDAIEAGHVGAGVSIFAHTGVAHVKKAAYWIRHEDVAGNLGKVFPNQNGPGIGVEMGGLVLGSGATQLNADADGNLWTGSGNFDSSPVRFSADGSVFLAGTGNNFIDIGAISTVVKAPKLVPASTAFSGSISVTLTSKTAGASAIYTTDGTTPSLSNGTIVANGSTITISATTTVKAVGLKLGALSTDSGGTGGNAVRVQTYTLDGTTCADPAANPPGGTFAPAAFPVSVTLSCSTVGASIYYSLDHLPAASGDGTLYTGTPVPAPSGATLYSRAFKAGLTPGPGLVQTYFPLSDSWNGGGASPGGYTPVQLLN